MLNHRNPSKLLAAVLLSGLALDAAANGFGLPDQDAFATARGEAFVATADNASAIFYNPAGITQLTNSNLRGGLNSVYYQPTYQPPSGKPNSGRTYYSSDNFAFLPQLFYTYSAKGAPLSFGLGIYAPYGGSMNWPQDTGFRQVSISGSLKYITINPVVAIRLLPGLSVGGGAMFNYGNIEMNQGLLKSEFPLTNFFKFSGDGWSVGYNAGILWQPYQKISFGATVRSSTSLNFQGNTDFQLQRRPYPTPTNHNASADFTFPLTTVFGVSYRPTPKWNIEFDANYTGWNSFDTVTIKQSKPVSKPLNQNVPVNLDWQASWMYEFGVTRYFENGWHVSSGYVFNANSVPDTYYTPLAADLNRNFFSLGAGFHGKRFDFDLAYQLGFAFKRDVSGSDPSVNATTAQSKDHPADGTYGFSSQAIIATVGVHF